MTTVRVDRCWSSFSEHFFAFFHGMLSGFDKEETWGKGSLVMSLLLTYSLLVTILLLNILVAMMSDTYNNVSEAADKQWNMERARIILTIEQELGGTELEKRRYWCEPVDGERYLQFECISETWARPAR
eukprot:TRINITY_DN78295_c0_g1_i1.p1 TRINITY_DN78295_c0_g1~~TRINITY_DN78295_c0_g1_i1.p1  ORF type:complete len:136 (+),score=20.69 TRINITY_DN78295_c0_g1_i1:23-409(+)